MQIRTLPMTAGWMWLRQALLLYRQQPFAFTALVIIYTMALMLLANLPLIGLPLAAALVPFGTVAITLAGRDAQRGVMPMPSLLIEAFRNPLQRTALLRLGGIHALMVVGLVLVGSLLAADDLRQWEVVDGQFDPETVAANMPWDAIIVAALLYIPVLMMTWFAPQIVAWHKQPTAKALFISFFAVWRNRWAFITLGVLIALLTIAVGWLATELLRMFAVSSQAASMLFAPVALVLTSIAYATQYPIYRSVIEPDAQ
jgi:hypothetical protein